MLRLASALVATAAAAVTLAGAGPAAAATPNHPSAQPRTAACTMYMFVVTDPNGADLYDRPTGAVVTHAAYGDEFHGNPYSAGWVRLSDAYGFPTLYVMDSEVANEGCAY